MTLQQLKYISMVEKCGSFSKAAQKLYVSQPSVSSLVHALEEELGITIFTRSSSGIAITNEGRQLLKLSNKLLRDADYIDEYFQRSAEGPKPSFFISSQHYDFVVSAFEEFVGGLDADRYTLGLNQNQTSVVIESVRKQSSDLGVIFLSDVNRRHMERVLEDNNLAFHRLVQARPHAFLSVTHPLAAARARGRLRPHRDGGHRRHRLDQHPRPRPAADRGGVPRVHETPYPRRAGVKLFPMDGDRDRVFLLSPKICYAGIQEKPYPGIFFMEVLL